MKLERSRAVLPPLSFSYQPLVTYFKCCQSKEKAEHSIELGGATFWGVLVFDPYANFTEGVKRLQTLGCAACRAQAKRS